MPKIGETKVIRSPEKHKGRYNYRRFSWQSCCDCGKERWVSVVNKTRLSSVRCVRCAAKRGRRGERHNFWKGGRWVNKAGYALILLQPNEPFYEMTHKGGYVMEHRLVMAQNLGRTLLRSESVHHKNGVRNDNRIENLELLSPSTHSVKGILCAHCELRKELRLQKWQIKNLEEQVRNLTATLLGVKE